MIFSKEDMDVLHSLYYNFSSFDIKLSRDPKELVGEQWQINAPNKYKTWLTGQDTSISKAYDSLMKCMADTGHFDPPEWNASL